MSGLAADKPLMAVMYSLHVQGGSNTLSAKKNINRALNEMYMYILIYLNYFTQIASILFYRFWIFNITSLCFISILYIE